MELVQHSPLGWVVSLVECSGRVGPRSNIVPHLKPVPPRKEPSLQEGSKETRGRCDGTRGTGDKVAVVIRGVDQCVTAITALIRVAGRVRVAPGAFLCEGFAVGATGRVGARSGAGRLRRSSGVSS